MGLLDDAIREHLELKRRRGADPDEVARQEDEALGDPRSGEFARAEGEADEQLAPEPSFVEAEQPGAYAAGAESERELDEDAWLDDEERLDDDDRLDAGPQRESDEIAEPRSEADVVRRNDEPAADDDVLEETPEFLQETPEHDRLWFEQKPPRDFDFDG
jgi:hypothetical protein